MLNKQTDRLNLDCYLSTYIDGKNRASRQPVAPSNTGTKVWTIITIYYHKFIIVNN